jgi:hypothetical protein
MPMLHLINDYGCDCADVALAVSEATGAPIEVDILEIK